MVVMRLRVTSKSLGPITNSNHHSPSCAQYDPRPNRNLASSIVQTTENFHEVIAQAREEDRKAMRAVNRPRKSIRRGRHVALPTTRIVKRLREKSDKSQPECVDQLKRHHKSYAVKKILECRLNPERQEMYLVWWEGYPKHGC